MDVEQTKKSEAKSADHCRQSLTVHLHPGHLEQIDQVEADLAHVVRAQLVLVLDPEHQALGVMTDGDAEELVPLGAQVVVNHLPKTNKDDNKLDVMHVESSLD